MDPSVLIALEDTSHGLRTTSLRRRRRPARSRHMRLEEASDWDAFARALSAREDVLRVAQPRQDGRPATFAQTAWPCAAPVSPFAVYLARGGRFHTVALDLDCGEER